MQVKRGRCAAERRAGNDTARKLVLERGVLISRIGPHDNILKIRPPMAFSTQNADLLLTTLDSVLSAQS